ncbi:MAG: hypothetical protein Q4D85_11950 [Corynebacterium sp.]|uniref:hypothetical protein n=1 Tax=Corynebacterium sp. TaxID=1720 RepID=UPI0026DAA616|nr:hypothetical protein [Corynebacterium sp.]MDO5099448.1 hypothetical protein [Corynebacterium sp.]
MKKLLFTLIGTGVLIAAEWWLVHSGVFSHRAALVCFVCAECGLGLFLVWRDPDHIVLRLLRSEWQMFRTFTALIRGRTIIPPGALPVFGTGNWWQIPLALTAATAIEILALELLLDHRPIRLLLIVISGYSVVILWASFGSRKTHPHYVAVNTLTLRHNREIIAQIPLDCIAKLHESRRFHAHDHEITADTLVLGSSEGTNVALQLKQPLRVVRPHYPWQKPQSVPVTTVLLWVDSDSVELSDVC